MQLNRELFKERFNHIRVKAKCLCGSDNGFRIGSRDRYGIEIMPFFCTACGHIYAKYRLSDLDLEKFYAETYRSLYTDGHGLKTFEAADSRIKASRRTILPALQSLRKDWQKCVVVEWGCGAGWNLVPFREHGIECYGFDLDREYIEYGRQQFRLDLQTIESAADSKIHFEKKADFLVLNHVLEHAIDPLPFLERVARLLRPDGLIYVGLPFLENLPTWRYRDYFHIAHLHYFSIPYFVSLAGASRWQTVESNKRYGFVVLQRGAVKAGLRQYRAYNGYLIVKFAFYYRCLYPIWRWFVEIVKKLPGAEPCYVRLMKFLGRPV